MAAPTLERAHALHRAGKLKDAVAAYRAVLKREPRNFDALYQLGIAHAQAGRFRDAAKCVARALELRPGHAQGHFDLGSLHGRLGRPDLAAQSLERAVALDPGHADALHNLGNALSELGRKEDALAAFDRAIALRPAFASAYFNRGNVRKALQHYEAAIEDYRKALEFQPDNVQVLNNLGNILSEVRRVAEAGEVLQRALEIDPRYAHAWYNLGQLQDRHEMWEDAAASFQRAVDIDPDYPFALGALTSIKMRCCDWDAVEALAPRVIAKVRTGKPVMDPFSFMGISNSAADQLTCAKAWIQNSAPPVSPALWRGEKYRHEKIRIAYVSADFHYHPMAFLMSGLFEHHDRDRFELTAIAFDPEKDMPIRQRMKDAFDRFIVARDLTDSEIARQLRELEIDIAVDRKGHTTNSRTGVFAYRPAPVQVNYLAYPGTMGAPYIDYIFADRFVIPHGEEKHYSEKVVRLPDTYQANDSRRPISEATPTRAEAGLPERGFVFCTFNNNYKINRPFFDLWMEILHEIDGSVLWLYKANAVAVRNLIRAAAEKGIGEDRLRFGGYMPNADHLARLRLADLSLDTLPYGAHTTASDSLYAGMPIVTCRGPTFAGAVTSGLLHAVGLPELVVDSLADYKALVLRLARDPDMLSALKKKLKGNLKTHPLFDTTRFTRHIEAAYERIWERSQRGEAPEGFDVPPCDSA